jgi:thiamine transport system permease protein
VISRSGLRRPTARRWLLAALPLGFFAVFFVYPVVSIIGRGLRGPGSWNVDALIEVFSNDALRRVLWFTVWQAALSTLLTVVVGLPAAYCFARMQFRGKRVLWAVLIVPFVLPTVVVASAVLGVVGPRSPIGIDLNGTIWAILLAHVLFNYAVVVRTVGAFWTNLDPTIEDAARVNGASAWQAFREVTWPLLQPAVLASTSIVFLFTFTSFGVMLLLGGLSHRTLEVEIYTQTTAFLRLDTAAALSIVQFGAVLAVLLLYTFVSDRRDVRLRARPARETSRPVTGLRRWFLAANLAFMTILVGLPLLVLVTRSIDLGSGRFWSFYADLGSSRRGSVLFVAPLEAVRNSLVFAAAATVVAVVIGGLAAFAVAGSARRTTRGGRWLDVALMVPLGVSAVMVGFGFVVALDEPPLDLRDSLLLVPLAHALVAVPFVLRALVPALRSIDPGLREAAAVLGASPARVWREVDLPIIGRAFAAAAGFAFAVSLGEFGATSFLARADWPTIPVAIARFLGQPGPRNFGQAMALSTILMVVTVVVVLAIDRWRVGGAGDF